METPEAGKHWLVQKYGGTSLGKLLDSITNHIIPSYYHDYNLAIVCSAISGTSKASGTTSLLIQCISHAEAGPAACGQLHECVDVILKNHADILQTLSESSNCVGSAVDTYQTALGTVQGLCEDLRTFLLAAQTVRDLSPQTRDRIIALGEKLSCIVLAAALTGRGVPAEAVMLDNVVEAVFGRSLLDQKSALNDLGGDFYRALSGEIAKRIHVCGTKVPVLSGFFGIMPESLLKAVGRGYSDLCAAMCAVGLNAVELQIWKEVDGIFTADPRKVPSARLLSTVTPDEATELTYYGSEVIHPLTMDQIRHTSIPLRLKNVFNPSGSGTVIYPSQGASPILAPVTPPPSDNEASNSVSCPTASFMLQNGYHGAQQVRRRPTAVTVKDSIILVNIACNRNTKSYGLLSGVFGRLEELGVNVDLVSTSERNVSVAFQATDESENISYRLRTELEKCGKVIVTKDMAIVSVIGHKMRNKVGVASEILLTLAAAKINIYLVSQGASEINVSLVVRSDDANLALNTIHDQVLKIPSHQEQEHDFIKGPWLY
ncbi:Aspartokinase [Fusarium sp. LHS14.1]|nr:Aspartokinase [Fusarium sp. LHS14.1]